METKDKDLWRDLFSAIPDETMPENFSARVMEKIQAMAALRKKRNRFWGISGYAAGIAVMLITCVIAFYNLDISFKIPETGPSVWTFPRFDLDIFSSPSFMPSLFIGILALLLLIADSTIRQNMEKKKK